MIKRAILNIALAIYPLFPILIGALSPALVAMAQETPLEVAPPQEKGEMRLMYHEVDMMRLKAKKEYGVTADMRRALKFCIEKSAKFDECRAETDYLRSQIEEQILHAKMNETERLKQQAYEESLKAKAPGGQTNIITQQHESITIINRPRYGERYETPAPRETEVPGFRPPPGFRPQNRFQAGDGFR